MKQRLFFNFSLESTGKPIISQAIRNFDMDFNILKAKVDHDASGQVLAEVSCEDENFKKMIHFMQDNGVKVRRVTSLIDVDKNKCVDCGTCVAACMVGALEMDENWHLMHHSEKCLECTLCVKACPVRAIHTLL